MFVLDIVVLFAIVLAAAWLIDWALEAFVEHLGAADVDEYDGEA